MTVKELIEKLQKVENKELIVIAELWMDTRINAVVEEDVYLVLSDDQEHAEQFVKEIQEDMA